VIIALTGNADEMQITWITEDDTATSVVNYGTSPNNMNMVANGSSTYYELVFYFSPYIHSVTLTGLQPNTKYYYTCGDQEGGWSSTFYFTSEDTTPVTPKNTVKILLTADVGATNNSQATINSMLKLDANSPFDFLIHSGDLSYANGWQPTWDDYGNMIQPLASHVPYMVATGNHEYFSLFVAFNARFNMPTNGYENLYYSFNYRNVHVLILNSESLNEFHWSEMYEFASADLQAVNRKQTPWVFVAFHHPFYCSNAAHVDSNEFMKDEYEDLFNQYQVDIVLQGHVHAYERTYPTYNWNVTPGAPVYVVNGHGGNGEGLSMNWQPTPSWSAYHESTFGFSTMEIFNDTHLYYQMIRTDDLAVRDDVWLVK
jgi:predicted MPP superfamily phosphohydrolase